MRPTVLIAVGDPKLRLSLSNLLDEAGIGIAIATDGAEALKLLIAKGGPRIALFDDGLARMSSGDVVGHLRARQGNYVYTGLVCSRDAVPTQAIFDTVIKRPVDAGDLVARMYGAVELMYPRRSREIMPGKMAVIDRETGVWAPETFDEFLTACLDGAPAKPRLVLLALRVDGLTGVGSQWGQRAAAMSLRACARSAREALRGTDAVCRTGPNTFLCLLQAADRNAAVGVARRICQRLETARDSVPGALEGVSFDHAMVDLSAEFEREPRRLRALSVGRVTRVVHSLQSAPPAPVAALAAC